MTLYVDRYTKTVLTLIAVMLMFVAVGLWAGNTPMSTPAYAVGGIPDSGQQLQKVVDGIDKIQASMDELSELLVSGKVKVTVVDPSQKTK